MKRKIFSLVLFFMAIFSGTVFAASEELGLYGKLTFGYQKSSTKIDFDYYSYDTVSFGEILKRKHSANEVVNTSGFEIIPTVGIVLPFSTEVPFGSFSYSIEPFVGFTLGGTDDFYWFKTTTTVICPGVNFILDYHFPTDFPPALRKLVPYVGAGFGVPISIVKTEFKTAWSDANDDSTDVYAAFRVNLLTGARYDFAKKFGVLVEMNLGFSNYFAWSNRIGLRYVFK